MTEYLESASAHNAPTDEQIYWYTEWLKGKNDPVYFINNYCHILHEVDPDDPIEKIVSRAGAKWVRFNLWDYQADVIRQIHAEDYVIILKARQLGLTWLVIAYVVWAMVYIPNARAAFWSYRDNEATDIIKQRLIEMYERLPVAFQEKNKIKSSHIYQLESGAIARAFSSTAGDSYKNDIAVIDEFELVQHPELLMQSVEPTVGDYGKLIIISRVDKNKPKSMFKKLYKGAKPNEKIFLGWHVRPDRDSAWYEFKKQKALDTLGHLDGIRGQYPANEAEALAPNEFDSAIPLSWLDRVYEPIPPVGEKELIAHGAPPINNLIVYHLPEKGRHYVIGIDPAEGNANSNDSAIRVFEYTSPVKLKEVACLAGKYTPHITAHQANQLSLWYNDAAILPERNNHGHTVINELSNLQAKILAGLDDKAGWLSNATGKTVLYDDGTEKIRIQEITIHNEDTYNQLASIEGATLRAPSDMPDDIADATMLAIKAVELVYQNQWYTYERNNDASRDAIIKQRLNRRRRKGRNR